MRTDRQDTRTKAQAAAARAGRARVWVAATSLFAVAAGLVMLLELGFVSFGKPEAIKEDPNAPEVTAQASTYANHLKGVDDNNMPYSISAVKAYQSATAEKAVDLETVKGNFVRPNNESLDVTSARGHYDTKKKLLNLEGEVLIKSSTDMTATMDKAQFNVATKQLESKSPVKVVLPDGEVTADHLMVDNNGEKIKFKGRVKASFGGTKQ